VPDCQYIQTIFCSRSTSFKCQTCCHCTDIFFEAANGISEVFERAVCKICKKVKLIGVGDLGYRTDFPNPDFDPWHAEFIRIDLKDALCETCANLNNIILDHSYFVAECTICNNKNSMKPILMTKTSNESLLVLLKYL
jgi:hypothetical protein